MTPCPELHIPHKEAAGREQLENWHALEIWARTRGCAGACECFVEHREAIAQTIPLGSAPASEGALCEPIEVTWDTTNTCGTLTDTDAMLMLSVNWFWEAAPNDPYLDTRSFAVNNAVSARGVWITDDANSVSIAGDTRMALGQGWCQFPFESADFGSITIPLNIYPGGQDFHVWVAQSSDGDLNLTMRADRFTVCGCSCVL